MIKKIIKIISVITASVIVATVLLVAFFWLKIENGVEITDNQTFIQTEPYIWNRIDLGDSCECSDGSDYWIYSKKGNSDNLIVHFQGGGACWNDYTCANPLVLYPFMVYYFPRISEWFFKALFSHGIMAIDLDENTFKDWNIVYILYCTGDLHIGNTGNQYIDEEGNTKKILHFFSQILSLMRFCCSLRLL